MITPGCDCHFRQKFINNENVSRRLQTMEKKDENTLLDRRNGKPSDARRLLLGPQRRTRSATTSVTLNPHRNTRQRRARRVRPWVRLRIQVSVYTILPSVWLACRWTRDPSPWCLLHASQWRRSKRQYTLACRNQIAISLAQGYNHRYRYNLILKYIYLWIQLLGRNENLPFVFNR